MQKETPFQSRTAEGAIFNQDRVCGVDCALIERLKQEASESKTRRYRICMHHSVDDPCQEMIVVHRRGNCSLPHYHPDAAMSYTMIEGEMDVLLFDSEGGVTRRLRLSTASGGGVGTVSLRLAGGVIYMPVCLTEFAVFHETLASSNPVGVATRYPEWGPAEDEPRQIEDFYLRAGVDRTVQLF